MDEEVVTELIQSECNSQNIKAELSKILDVNHRKKLIEKYHLLEEKLGGEGASKKVAKLILKDIS
jgi:lipid-A-disaccharide synthase